MTERQAATLINTVASLLARGKPAPSVTDEIATAIGADRNVVTAMLVSSVRFASRRETLLI